MNMGSVSSDEDKYQRERTDNIEAFEGRTGSLDVCFFQGVLENLNILCLAIVQPNRSP